MIKSIKAAVTIPVMAKARIGHFVEAQILEALGIDYIDESEVLTPADDVHHINKHTFKVPFVCGCRDLGEALRRIAEGAAMIRTKGEAGTGNVVEAVRHARAVQGAIRALQTMDDDELYVYAKVGRVVWLGGWVMVRWVGGCLSGWESAWVGGWVSVQLGWVGAQQVSGFDLALPTAWEPGLLAYCP